MEHQLNTGIDLELLPMKALRKRIKAFKQQQIDDLVNFIKAKDKAQNKNDDVKSESDMPVAQ